MDLFRKINYELIQDIVDTVVEYYKIVLDKTESNIYDESHQKFFYEPVTVPTVIQKDPQAFQENQTGQVDYNQTSIFYFLRDMMLDRDLVPEVGDIIKYDNFYWEVDSIVENNYFGNSNPDTALAGQDYGYNVNFECSTHRTDETITLFREVRKGNNPSDFELPDGL